MNVGDFAESSRALLAVTGALRDDTLSATALKTFCSLRLLTEFGPGETFAVEDLLVIAEELEVPFPAGETVQMVLETGAFERAGDGELRVRDVVSLNELFPTGLRGRKIEVPLEEVRRLLSPEPAPADSAVVLVRPRLCQEAVARSWAFASEVVRHVLDARMQGVPVFWRCEGGPHLPLMDEPGTATTMDTALLFASAAEFRTPPDLDAGQWRSLQRFVEDVLLRLQRRSGGWDDGAFVIDGPDEDFVGAFLPKYAHLGAPPTVDGTADALLSLCLLHEFTGNEGFGIPALPAAIAGATRFLLRQQHPDGGWPVYRYEDDAYRMATREYSSSLASSGLVTALRAGMVSEQEQPAVRDALERYARLLGETAIRDGEHVLWFPGFSHKGERDSRALYSTLWIARSLFHLTRLESTSGDAAELLPGALAFLESRWEPDPQTFAIVPFRVPTWGGPALEEFTWELPADPMIAALLLRVASADAAPVSSETWAKVHQVVTASIESERHGHWVDFLMKQSGDDRAVPGNTRYNQELLLAYLHYLRVELAS